MSVHMADLITRLRAGLDEDEAAAKPQAEWLREREHRPGDWMRFMFDPVIGPFGGQSPLRSIDRGLYVGRMADPHRVLREVEAKRQIIALCETETDETGGRPLAVRILHLLGEAATQDASKGGRR